MDDVQDVQDVEEEDIEEEEEDEDVDEVESEKTQLLGFYYQVQLKQTIFHPSLQKFSLLLANRSFDIRFNHIRNGTHIHSRIN